MKRNDINDFVANMNELQMEQPDIDISGNWYLYLKEGLLKFDYSKNLPEDIQLKCIKVFVDTLSHGACFIGSY
jgi:hypothetical protein